MMAMVLRMPDNSAPRCIFSVRNFSVQFAIFVIYLSLWQDISTFVQMKEVFRVLLRYYLGLESGYGDRQDKCADRGDIASPHSDGRGRDHYLGGLSRLSAALPLVPESPDLA
jgi:hypothetical protein